MIFTLFVGKCLTFSSLTFHNITTSVTTTIYRGIKFMLYKFPGFQSMDYSEYSHLDAGTE